MNFTPQRNELISPSFQPDRRVSPYSDELIRNYMRYLQGKRLPKGLNVPSVNLGSWLDGPKFRGPTPESIKILVSANAAPACISPHIRIEEAYGRAYEALRHYVPRSIECLDPMKHYLYPGKDLPFKVFNQLDRELFRSVLKGNVHLAWSSNIPPNVNAVTFRKGYIQKPRISIRLAESLLEGGNNVEILAVLVHQMIHAYYLQCCGFQNGDNKDSGYDLGHGFEFEGLLRSIESRLPKGISRYLRDLRPHHKGSPREQSLKSHRNKHQTGGSNCVHAPDYSSPEQEVDCKQWCHQARAIAASLEDSQKSIAKGESSKPSKNSQFDGTRHSGFYTINGTTISGPISCSDYGNPPLESYIEIHFQSKVFPFHRNEVSQHIEGLNKSPAFTKNRILTLPPESRVSDLIALYQFLRQDPKEQSSQEVNYPLIEPYSFKSASPTVDAISAYHLALHIAFPSFAIHNLSRLSPQSALSDPISVLEAIYHPQPHIQNPDAELRRWARTWLSASASGFTNSRLLAISGSTNLDILQKFPEYTKNLHDLRRSSTHFAEDLDAVQARIEKRAEAKSPQVPSDPQRPMAPHHFPVGEDPRYFPCAVPIWQNGHQLPVQAEQAYLPAAIPPWRQHPINHQAVGQVALPTLPHQHQINPWIGIPT